MQLRKLEYLQTLTILKGCNNWFLEFLSWVYNMFGEPRIVYLRQCSFKLQTTITSSYFCIYLFIYLFIYSCALITVHNWLTDSLTHWISTILWKVSEIQSSSVVIIENVTWWGTHCIAESSCCYVKLSFMLCVWSSVRDMRLHVKYGTRNQKRPAPHHVYSVLDFKVDVWTVLRTFVSAVS